GTVWGGEWFVGRGPDFTRVGHLLPVSLPGGDKAAVEIWRMGVSWLMAAFGEERGLRHAAHLFNDCDAGKVERLARICRRPGLSATTSSAGRLFDAVAAIAGLRTTVTYEGQAAMELEAAYDDRVEGEYEIRLRGDASSLVIDPRPAIRAAVSDRLKNAPPAVLSTRFHRGMARAVVSACARISESTGLNRVAAGGGVFQNMRLLDLLDTAMLDADLEWFVPSRVPANDGGIALGQAWIAAQKLREGR
ncbi:carbamoyltransferase HypF, partial [bacterium]|nr:carbamoyltransferase HypF [bacterium]